MPLLFEGSLNLAKWKVWKMEESDAFYLKHLPSGLLGLEQALEYQAGRKSEWLCSRFMLYHLFHLPASQNLASDEYGRKFLHQEQKFFYSISHSRPYVAVLESEVSAGIDIQKWRANMETIAPRFLHTEELAFCQNNVDLIHAFWCAKEAMFKAYAGRGIEFKSALRVNLENFHSKLSGEGRVIKNNHDQIYKLHFHRFNEGLMAISIPTHD